MRILILKPSSLGDVVQALPVLRLLRRHFPSGEVYWWLDRRLRGMLAEDAELTGIIEFDRERWGKPQHWPELVQSIRRLRAMRFDWVIDLQSLARSGLFAWLANGGLCVGLDDAREGARGFYDLIVSRPSFLTHAVDWYLEVLRRLQVPVGSVGEWLPVRPKAAARVREHWCRGHERWVVVQPGGRWPNKLWPVERFADLVRRLLAHRADLKVVVLGGADDQPLGQVLASVCPDRCLDLCGRTSLSEMIEWIRLSRLMVTNDTGPMHVAAAVGTRVVALFGPTEARRTGPYGQIEQALSVDLPCRPCLSSHCRYHLNMECMKAIPVERVFAAVQGSLTA